MSLEQAILDLTVAVLALNKSMTVDVKAIKTPSVPAIVAQKATITQAAGAPAPQVAKEVEEPENLGTVAATDVGVVETIGYDALKKKLLVLIGKDREAAIELLAKYGAKNGTELRPADYTKINIDLETALNESLA